MKTLTFQPTKILLGFRLLGVAVASIVIAGIAAGICVGAELAIPGIAAFALGFLGSCILIGGYTVLYFFSIRYELDDRYISKSCGVIWKQRRSVPLEKITNLDVRQGPFERIFGYGKVWVFTPSTGGVMPEEQLLGIPKPHEMKKTMIERSEAAKHPQSSANQGDILKPTGEVLPLLTEIRDSLIVIKTFLLHQERKGKNDPA